MYWIDITLLMLSATLANHLGLIEAIEHVINKKIPVVNCAKCFTFWSVLVYSLFQRQYPIVSVAMSFLCAYSSVWLEMLLGYVNLLYIRCHESLFTQKTDDETSSQS
jgi:hypothetical protein